MQAIFFAIISYFTWGAGVFVEAIAARRLGSYSLVFWSFVLSFLVTSFYIPFELPHFRYTSQLFLLNLGLSLVSLLVGTIAYYEALKKGNRALVGTIASSFPMITVLFSVLFFHEPVSTKQVLAIGVVFTGLFLSMFSVDSISKKKVVVDKAFILALVTMVCWGMYFAFIKFFVERVGWFWPNYVAFLTFPLVFLYMKFNKIKLEGFTKNNVLMPLIISTILVRIAEFSYNLGISKGLVAVVAPIAGANPTLFVIFAFFFFKDKITKQQVVGIVTTLVGIVMLSFFSV